MMRKALWIALFFLLALPAGALAVRVDLSQGQPSAAPGISLVEQGDDYVIFDVAVPALTLDPVKNDEGRFFRLAIAHAGVFGRVGQPQLPSYTAFVRLPATGEARVSILKQAMTRVDLSERGILDDLLPVQPPRDKCDPCGEAAPFAYDTDLYSQNRWIGKTGASTRPPAVIRGVRVLPVTISPIRYNPAVSELEVATWTRVRVDFTEKLSAVGSISDPVYADKTFMNLVDDLVINGFSTFSKGDVPGVEAGASFLIISAPGFVDNAGLVEYADWKTQKGFRVQLLDTDTTGATKEAIQSYILDVYTTWEYPPAYVVLVGDSDTIPYFLSEAYDTPSTDLYYAAIDGADYFPDLFVSRLSVADATDLDNALAKILEYEQGTWASSDDWTKKATFMASSHNYDITEGTHNYCIDTYLEPDGYTVNKRYSQTYSATIEEVIADLNGGLGLLVYSGHGSITGWSDGPPMNAEQVNALTNTVYPFVASHACVTGQFESDECFMETWLRTESGAVTSWGSSVNSQWDEDDILQRRYFDGWWTLNHTTIGAFTVYGMLELYTHYEGAENAHRYFEMYNLMGDASLDLWTAPPVDLSVVHTGVIYFGAMFYNVTVTDGEGVLCALAKDGVLYGASLADVSGDARIDFDAPISDGGDYTLTCTGHNKQPYVGLVPATSASSDGILTIDRDVYGHDYQVNILVTDMDLVGQGTLTVFANSDTELVEEQVELTEYAGTGAYSGYILTDGSQYIKGDGKLQIADGDFIMVRYHDDDNGQGPIDKYELAKADLRPPDFDGVDKAAFGDQWVELEWDLADDENGPITYSIYMADTSGGQDFDTPLDTTANLHYKATGLTNGEPCFFVVRATDGLNNQDDNTVEISVTPTEPSLLWQETWDSTKFFGTWDHEWEIIDGGDTAHTWNDGNACERESEILQDNFMVADSDCAGQGVTMDEKLISETIDVSDYRDLSLRVTHYFNSLSETADIDVSLDAGDWENVASYKSDVEQTSVLDLSDRKFDTIQVRFHYYNANYDWYWLLDNVELWGWPALPDDDDDDDDDNDDDTTPDDDDDSIGDDDDDSGGDDDDDNDSGSGDSDDDASGCGC